MTRFAVNGIHLNVEDNGGEGTSPAPAPPAAPMAWGRYSMQYAVADLLAVFDQLGVEQTVLLGYSMGGRLALHLALAAPEPTPALFLESASPGIDDPTEREARRAPGAALAGRNEGGRTEGLLR